MYVFTYVYIFLRPLGALELLLGTERRGLMSPYCCFPTPLFRPFLNARPSSYCTIKNIICTYSAIIHTVHHYESAPANMNTAQSAASASSSAQRYPQTFYISSRLLPNHVNRTVRVIGRVTSVSADGKKVQLESCDGGSISIVRSNTVRGRGVREILNFLHSKHRKCHLIPNLFV
jgi:hypothetical protein